MNKKIILIILIILILLIVCFKCKKETFTNAIKTIKNIDKIYVINLKKNTDRLEKFMENAKKANVKVERFDAIYGKDLHKDHPDIFKYFIYNLRYLNIMKHILKCVLLH